ncbi:MAG: carboxypeptidase regulatory-like domain-containing protein [Lewinellaceae bacterium]|nr:carboxypeptidase regulatory-like domain-containing protein [Lewinellaceae bacterium]
MDDDGIQDPAESGINGVTITLWKDAGGGNFSQIASTISAGGGFYGFSSKASGTAPGVTYNVAQLLPGMDYEIRIANVAGPSQQATLDGCKLGKANQDPGATGDLHDSDAAANGNDAVIASITTGTAGHNNHTYDIAMAPNTDYGDLPDNNMAGSYPTNNTAGPEGAGACHEIVAGLKIGASVDIETDGQPSANADGDDLGFSDDEDGIASFPSFIAGQMATVSVTVMNMQTPAAAATLYGFIDWNKDGDFLDASESTTVAAPDGTNGTVNLVFNVPATAILNMDLGARFRLSTQAGLTATGCAQDGEVEDYMVQVIGFDYGDLPDNDLAGSYPTNATDGAGEGVGACHQIVPNLKIGASVDAEAAGQPSATANGDDTGGADDENGIAAFPTFIAGQSATVAVTVMNMTGGVARLYGFIDWNKDGDFLDLNEAVSASVPNGTNGLINLNFTVPITSVLNMDLGARFRLSTQSGLTATACAPDGEVEDYMVQAVGYDYGDLPDDNLAGSYPTDATNGAGEGIGACHQIIPNLKIGANVDVDAAAQPDALAEGDDNNGSPDDEDGIAIFPDFLLNNPATVNVSVMNMTGSAATLYGFIDWNKDGDFLDANESVSSPVPNGTNGNIALNFNVPSNAVLNMVLGFRIRLSNQAGLTATGCANSGEVEDYFIEVLGFDYGDLPDNDLAGSYPTNVNDGAGEGSGACHLFKPGLKIGTLIDFEANGQPSATANGDDTNAADDEDGIASFPQFIVGKTATVAVTVMNMQTPAAAATLYGFIDWNKDGDFNDLNESVSAPAPNGTNGLINLTFTVPASAVLNTNLGARFRLSTAFVTASDCAPDGEVEDYVVQAIAFDWGDLPDNNLAGSYPTNATNGAAEGVGASHQYYPTLKMGATLDFEGDGQPSALADGDGADEDGVTFPTLILGQTANVTVSVMNMFGADAKLTAYFDWNKNGILNDPGEMYFTTVTNGFVGNINLPVNIPVTALYNTDLGVRFRLSTDATASMLPTGQAPDGEVEDYLVQVIAYDYGDLPDNGAGVSTGNYQTADADNGPFHQIFSTIKIGNTVDAEGDGQQNTGANGDDGASNDDEELTVPLLQAGFPATIEIDVMNMTGAPAGLYGFFDWNGDGDFDDAGETVSAIVLSGTNGPVPFTLNIPANAILNTPIGLRFRLSTDPAASAPTGFAADGEVEDYLVEVKSFDYGDLPDGDTPGSYATNATNGGGEGVGPSHEIVPGLKLGAGVDGDLAGQPSVSADGDDSNGNLTDDEDGVIVPMFELNVPADVSVTLMNMTGGDAKLTLFIDWNGNGLFSDAGEMYSTTVADLATGYVFNVTPPANAVLNKNIGVRVRLSTDATASMSPTGPAPDGEVEDYIAQVMSFDYGDLPDAAPGTAPGNYQTQNNDNGPVHKIVTGLKLGASVDGETNGNQSALANGDDTSASDDENGVTFPALTAGTTAVIPVNAMNMTGQPAALFGFFDWNKDGDFDDAGESVTVTVPNGTNGNVNLNVVIPVNAVPNMSLGARLRISTDYLSASEPEGAAPDGEVEDYLITVLCPLLRPSATPTPVSCYAGSDGSIAVEAGSIGTAPWDFAWDGPGANDGSVTDVASPYAITGLPTGIYTITVTDSDGCTGTTSTTISQPGSPVSLSLLSENVSCNGDSDGSINLMVAGGTFPYTYDWSNDGPDSPDDDTEDLTNLAPNTYTVTVSDAKGCIATVSATISQPTPLTASGVATDVTCTGGTDGAIDLTASGGTLPYTYDWTNDGSENPDDDSADLNGIAAGTYTVTVTDANGCVYSTSVVVDEPPSGMVLSIAVTDATCGLSNGALDLTVTGGTPNFTYDWSNDGPDTPDDDTEDLSNISAGLYFVTVTDDNGCTTSSFAVVGNTDAPEVTAVGTDPLCNGGNDGSVDITVTGGTAPFTYSWSNNETSEDISGLTAGKYIVTVTDDNGCKTMTMVTLTEPTILEMYLTPVNEGLCGDAAGSITAFASGGVGSNDGPDNPDDDLPTISGLAAGTYTVTVTDDHGCEVIQQTTLTCVQPASIGNYTWIDENANGIQDQGEDPLPNVTVVLDGTDINGNMVNETAVTDANGAYLFDNLWPGTYKLTFATPAGYVPTTANDPDANPNDSDDSDANPAMGGMTVFEVLSPGENNPDYDAGFYQLGFDR